MASTYKPTYTKDGTKRQTARYHVRFRDHLNTRRRVPALTDKRVSDKLGEKLDALVGAVRAGGGLAEHREWIDGLPDGLRDSLAEWGLLPGTMRSLAAPLTEHVDGYRTFMLARNATDAHADLRRARVLDVFKGCGFQGWRDINAEKIEQWLADERQAGRLKMRTSNHYVTAVRAFCTWMVDQGRAASSPVSRLARVTVTDQQSFGVFTVEQVEQLVRHCHQATDVWGHQQRKPRSGTPRADMTRFSTGPERAFIYRLAVETAMRANTIRGLTVGQVRLDRDENGRVAGGVIKTSVGQQKNRKSHDVPVRRSFAQLLEQQTRGKAPAMRLVDLPLHAAEMLRADLFNAQVPLVDADELPLKFHSFRATCATWLGEAGLDAAGIAAVTGHLTRTMVDHYTHRTKRLGREAIEQLPELRMTGTDELAQILPNRAPNSASACTSMPLDGTINPGGVAERSNAPVLKTGRPSGVSRVRIPPPPLFHQTTLVPPIAR